MDSLNPSAFLPRNVKPVYGSGIWAFERVSINVDGKSQQAHKINISKCRKNTVEFKLLSIVRALCHWHICNEMNKWMNLTRINVSMKFQTNSNQFRFSTTDACAREIHIFCLINYTIKFFSLSTSLLYSLFIYMFIVMFTHALRRIHRIRHTTEMYTGCACVSRIVKIMPRRINPLTAIQKFM